MVDYATQTNFNSLFNTNKGMMETTYTQFNKWQQGGLPVHKIICDNTEDNVLMEKSGE